LFQIYQKNAALTTRESEIYSALKTANEVQEEKLELELKTLADKKIQRKAAYISANPRSSFSVSLVSDDYNSWYCPLTTLFKS